MITREIAEASLQAKPLGEVAEFLDSRRKPVKQADRKPGPYPYYGANGKQGTIDGFIFDEPLVLLAEDGGFFDDPDRGIAYRIEGKSWVNNHAHVIKPKDGLDFSYLCRVLENYDVRPFINGSTRSKLTKTQASQIPIPLPPLEEQKRISAILDQADALRRLRQRAIDRLNNLSHAIFHEMFGDWRNDRSEWPISSLGEHLDFLTSGSRGWAKYYSDRGAKFIRIQNVRKDYFDETDMVFVQAPDSAESKRTKVQPGDVLLSITADLGRTAVIPDDIGDAHINQHLAILRASSFNSRFLSSLLASPACQQDILKRNREGVKAGLNFDDVRGVKIITPPRSIQNEYDRRISHLERGKNASLSHKDKLFELFASLQHRAFNREL